MTLDELIIAAKLTVKEAIVLDEMMQHEEATTEQLVEAIKVNNRKTLYRGKDKKNYTKRNVRTVIHNLNSKLVQADTGYAVIKVSGIGRGNIGVYRLRRATAQASSQ